MATKKFITKNGILSNNVQFVDEIGNSTQSITLTMDSLGTLSFDGTNGQLFSVTDNMSGTIFSVNDISGIPSIEVIDDGTIRLAEFSGNILVGTATDDGINKLQVNGDSIFSGQVDVGHDLIITNKNGTNPADAGNLYFQEAGATWGTDFYGFRFNHEGSLNYLKLQSANLTNVIDVMTIIRDSGNVGIGKIPTQKLDVNGNIAVTGTVAGRNLVDDGDKLDGIAPNANNYVLPASVVHDNEVSALHATDALRVSGTTLSLYKGDGTFESVTTQDTIYTHPTTDGNKHVPANGTTNTGKVLTASATAGVYTWETPSTGVTDHTLLTNIGTNTHAQIDTHIADGTKHFTMGSISITESQISDFGSYSLSTHNHSNYLVTTSAPVFGTDTITSRTANTSLSLAGNGTGSVYVNDSLVVTGDLTIQGTTTTLNTADLLVEDKNIVIGNVATPSDTTADGGGITLLGTTNKTILWSDATNTWDFNQGLNITGTVTATSFSGNGAGLTSLNADTLGSVAASNYTRLDTTNLGKTTPTSDTVTNTAAEWSALPVGYSSFMSATIGTAGGAPVNNFGYFTKIANRDTSGGWSGLWSGYSAGQHYLGRAATNADMAIWEKIWTDANDGAGSGLDADKLDGQEGSYYRNASNINAGTINDAYLPATISSDINGNANTATTLATARSINGTSFNGSSAITTAKWGTSRNITIGNTLRAIDGSAPATWSLADIGAEPAFTKNTGFNKNFGTTTGTVAQGDDSRIINGQTAFTWGNHATAGYLTSVTGADVTLSTTNFNGNLSSLENTVQKAFDKLDDIAAGASTTKTISEAIATQGQTTFTVSYLVGKIEVFVGGVKVKPGNYTASNGTSVVFDYGLDEGSWVQFVSDDNAVPGTLDWGAITGTPNTLAGYGMSVSFSDLSLHPTTIAGYGITDAFDGAFTSLTGVPNTIAGYGIIDAFDGAFSSLTGLPTTLASHGITNPGFLGGTPTTTTQAQSDRTTALATTEFVQNEVNPEITYISSAQHNNLMMIIGGKLYTASGSSAANWNSGTGRGLDAQMNTYGVEEAREVVFPDETASTLLQAGGDGLVVNFALFDNGNLYTWGRNDNAACGLGHTTAVGVPTLAATNVAKVWSTPFENYSITSQSLIIQKTDGYLYGCGENNDGELGLGNTTSPITSFTQMTWAGTNPIYVYNSNGWGGMTLVQKSDGTIWTCGYQNQGALFNGVSSASPLSTPVDITANVGGAAAGNVVIARHTYGYYNTAAVVASCSMLMRRTGAGVTSVYTVGDNGWGAIGNGTTTDTVTPYAVPNMSDVADITWCGDIPAILALKTNGDLWGWGRNSEGQMGDGTINSKLTPAVIATGVSKILSRDVATNTYGYQFPMFILKNDNFVYGTGFNTTYQLGLGDTTNKTAWTRLNIPSDDPVKMIGSLSSTSSTKGTIAVTEKNNLWVWGSNNNNTLSPHTASHIIYPTKMRINAGSN